MNQALSEAFHLINSDIVDKNSIARKCAFSFSTQSQIGINREPLKGLHVSKINSSLGPLFARVEFCRTVNFLVDRSPIFKLELIENP